MLEWIADPSAWVALATLTLVSGCATTAQPPRPGADGPQLRAENRLRTGDGQPGSITMQIRNHMLAIQHGTIADTHNWVHKVC